VNTLRRVLFVLLAAVVVGLTWKWFGGTTWGASVDAMTAGEQFTSVTEPVRLIAGALLIAVPTVLLVRAAWAWLHPSASVSRRRT